MTVRHRLWEIDHLVEVGTKLTKSWFRGHATVCSELTPRIYRKEFAVTRGFRDSLEHEVIEHFMREAPVLSDYVPDNEDIVSWLFLMQHHGAPTRLLDWTRSPLIALYFAVCEKRNEDGELWAMYPQSLNKLSGIDAILLPRSEHVAYLAEEPGWTNRDNLAEKHCFTKSPRFPVAVYPPVRSQRMAAQLSVFTIHPEPANGNTIPELLKDKQNLVCYEIPAAAKRKLWDDLSALGITRRALFPDLDGLAGTIIDDCRFLAYVPPDPPHWDTA